MKNKKLRSIFKLSPIFLAISTLNMPLAVHAADFTNGGFEAGNPSGWTVTGGTWNGTPNGTTTPYAPLDPANYSGAGVSSIVNPTTSDIYITRYNTINGTSITPVFDGNNAVRINDANNNNSVSVISQSVTNYVSNKIYIAWLAVLEGSHAVTDSDHFVIKLRNNTTSTDVATISYSSANTASFFTDLTNGTPTYNGIYVSGWRAQAFDVTAGQDYTLSLLAADCPYGGHWGYVYLDFAGSVAPTGLTITSGQPGATPNIVAAGNVSGGSGVNLISTQNNGASPNYYNVFDGGTLSIDTTGQTYSGDFSITSNGALIDQNGNAVTLSGVFSDNASDVGSLQIINTGSGGAVTLTGVNLYTGSTTIDSGATLIISSAGVLGAGDYAGNISNSGTLTYNSTANQVFSGIVSGDGVLNKSSTSTLTLNGVNTFSGTTNLTDGTLLVGSSANNSTARLLGTVIIGTSGTLAGYGTVGSSATTLINNGTVSPGNNSVAVLNIGGAYAQAASGNLSLDLTPTTNDQLAVVGAANLDGSVTVNGSSGTYSPTRYTLLTSSGRAGTFSTLNSDLSSYTSLGYFISYDTNNVYLTLGPDSVNTTLGLSAIHDQLKSIFAAKNESLLSGLSYDCNLFGENNICLSTGGRLTYTSSSTDKLDDNRPSNASALLIGAYRADKDLRIGAWIDQDLYTQNKNIRISNSNPMIGLFGVYYPSGNSTGLQAKASLSYVDKKVEITRDQLANTEPGQGSTKFKGFGAQFELAYGLDDVISESVLSPFIGVRNYDSSTGAYSEVSSATVQVPVNYSKYSQRASMVFSGLKLEGKLSKELTYNVSGGLEKDTNANNPSYAGTSNIYGLSSFNLNSQSNQRESRMFANVGTTYLLDKNETLSLGVSFREDRFKGTSLVSGMLTYTIGL